MIPKWLIVTGVFALVTVIVQCGARIQKNTGKYPAALCCLFNFSWFIAGNVWVFGNWSSYQAATEPTCDKTTYMFSFVLLIMAWVAAPIFCILGCFCGAGAFCLDLSSN